jgi:hypothetical protein
MVSPSPPAESELIDCQETDPEAESGLCGAAIVADERCLAHLTSEQLSAYLETLRPGSNINARREILPQPPDQGSEAIPGRPRRLRRRRRFLQYHLHRAICAATVVRTDRPPILAVERLAWAHAYERTGILTQVLKASFLIPWNCGLPCCAGVLVEVRRRVRSARGGTVTCTKRIVIGSGW